MKPVRQEDMKMKTYELKENEAGQSECSGNRDRPRQMLICV